MRPSPLHATALATIALLALLGAGPAPTPAGAVPAVAPEDVHDLVFPVAGPASYTDTWGACRGTGCSRSHEGTDIFAPKLTPVVATRDGVVSYTAVDRGISGNMVAVVDDEGWRTYYIHLNNDTPGTDDGANPPGLVFGPGIRRGARVRAGQVVGYTGDSGNAEHTPPHTHFELHRPDRTKVNPTPSLDAARRARRLATPVLPDPALRAWVDALHEDFLGRGATDLEQVDQARTPHPDRASRVRAFTRSDAWIGGSVSLLYRSTLGRDADAGGRAYWVERVQAGLPLSEVAVLFHAADEYRRRAGGTDEAWIAVLYDELLGRRADAAGLAYWTGLLRDGTHPDVVAGAFADSQESREARVRDLYDRLLDRAPDRGGLAHWADVLRSGDDLDLATSLASSDEYLGRAAARAGDR